LKKALQPSKYSSKGKTTFMATALKEEKDGVAVRKFSVNLDSSGAWKLQSEKNGNHTTVY